MSRMCNVCGGLVSAPNEVLGYSGPMCNGLHGGFGYQNPDHSFNVQSRLYELEKRLTELTDLVATDQDTNTDVSNPQSKATLKKGD